MTDAPPLEASDWQALTFYFENATAFVQEFGLMPKFIDEMQLSGQDRRVFLAKLSKIHGTVLEMRAEEIERRSK